MARRSRPSQRSVVLGAIKDKPSVAKWPSLTGPARDAPQFRGRDEGMAAAVEQRNWPKKRRGNDKGLSGGARHLPPEARSRRRDAGSGQAAIRVVATDHAHPRLADLSSLNPIRWRSSHRPRTEAKSRRRMSQVERGIDKQRPVTEARIERGEIRDRLSWAMVVPNFAALHPGYAW